MFIKILKKIFIISLGLLVCFIGFVFVINTSPFDDDLKPELLTLMDMPARVIPESDNAFYFIMGFRAEEDKSPHVAGTSYTLAIQDIIAENYLAGFSDDLEKQYLGIEKLSLNYNDFIDDELCTLTKEASRVCLQETLNNVEDILLNIEQNKILLDRYKQLIQYPHFNISYIPSVSAPFPDYGTPMYLQKLYLYEAYISYQGDPETLINILNEDVRFWRMMLSESNDLVSRMVSIKAITRNVAFISGLIQLDMFKNIDKSLVENSIRLLSPEELDMSLVIIRELIFNINLLRALNINNVTDTSMVKWDEALVYKHFMQLNATLNMAYEHYNQFINMSRMTTIDYDKFIKDYDHNEHYVWSRSFSNVYNPGGKILTAIGAPALDNYISRVHDLAAYLNLVGLQLELNSEDTELEDTVANSIFRNPFTGAAIVLDSGNRRLSIECMSSAAHCVINF